MSATGCYPVIAHHRIPPGESIEGCLRNPGVPRHWKPLHIKPGQQYPTVFYDSALLTQNSTFELH
jgi:hypothetical protein